MVILISMLTISFLMLVLLILFMKYKDITLQIQIANSFNSLIVIMIALYCYYINKPEYIDIALLYVVISYVSIIATRKYFQLNGKKDV
jgi:multicomponent Na+:H+ antiporter subunit F